MKFRKILACVACAVMTVATLTVTAIAGENKEVEISVTPASWNPTGGATALTNVGFISSSNSSANLKLTLKSIEINGVKYIYKGTNNSVDLAADDDGFPNAWDGTADGTVIAESESLNQLIVRFMYMAIMDKP